MDYYTRQRIDNTGSFYLKRKSDQSIVGIEEADGTRHLFAATDVGAGGRIIGVKEPSGGLSRPLFPSVGNQIIKIYPTLRCKPFAGNGNAGYTSITPSGEGAAIAIDEDQVDASTGLSMAKVTIPAGNTSYQSIDYLDMEPWQMQPNDVWMLSVYLPERVTDVVLQVMVSDASSISGIEYRLYQFVAAALQKGHNLLSCLHVETFVNASTYGVVGTSSRYAWINTGTQTDESASRSVRIRARMSVASGDETVIHIGALHTAPAGWAKAAVMWYADDVPSSFMDLVVPIIEGYGWKYSVAVTSQYSADPGETYASMSKIKAAHAKGNEIWGHLRRHENMDTETTGNKTRALKVSADFWKAQGIQSASQVMAWPFGAYDDESITLAKGNGYLLAASIHADAINPLIAGTNPFYLNRFSAEISNSWQVDSMLKGSILRGQGLITYMHNAIAGGAGLDTYPGSTSFYVEHFKRWAELVAIYEAMGKCIVTTPLEYLRMCGISYENYAFAE